MTSPSAEHGTTGRRLTTQAESLSSLVGAHPDALRQMFTAGHPPDPAELGPDPNGSLLAIAPVSDVYLALRPLVRALGQGLLPWRGMTFDHGGNSGENVLLGLRVLRFQAEVGPSLLDGRDALVLTYDTPAYGHPWPFRALRDELRAVGKGIAIGPALLVGAGAPATLLWFGLAAAR